MSISSFASKAAEPLDDPPLEKFGFRGFNTVPKSLVWLPPDKHRFSHEAFPTIVAPASRSNVTTDASFSGI